MPELEPPNPNYNLEWELSTSNIQDKYHLNILENIDKPIDSLLEVLDAENGKELNAKKLRNSLIKARDTASERMTSNSRYATRTATLLESLDQCISSLLNGKSTPIESRKEIFNSLIIKKSKLGAMIKEKTKDTQTVADQMSFIQSSLQIIDDIEKEVNNA